MAGHAKFVICEQSIERTLSWLNRFRRLKIRYEHRADIHLAFLQLGCSLISLRFLG
jgi:transposase